MPESSLAGTPLSALKRTVLYAEHVRLGARMVAFAGWEMPVQYQSILQEHRAVRTCAGAFDVSHMGEFQITGPGALAMLQYLTPTDVAAIPEGGSQYSCFLRPDGGIIDDIVVYCQSRDRYLIVVNAANVEKVADWLREHARPDATVRNISDETALIAVQGPEAVAIVDRLTADDLTALPRRGIQPANLAGVSCLVARTGYTGEDGLEIFCAPDGALVVWRMVLQEGERPVVPCGLGARDTLRLEAGNLLYGHDIDESTNPLEAGLGFLVKFEKGDFIGREALLKIRSDGLTRRLIGFEMVDRGIPRAGCPVLVDGQPVGQVTSGSYAPTLDRNIGLAYVASPFARPDQEIQVVIRDRPLAARVVRLPFYRSRRRPGSS